MCEPKLEHQARSEYKYQDLAERPELVAAEPRATAERKHELRIEAARQARQSPLYFNLTISLSKSSSIFHASLGRTLAGQGMPVSV